MPAAAWAGEAFDAEAGHTGAAGSASAPAAAVAGAA